MLIVWRRVQLTIYTKCDIGKLKIALVFRRVQFWKKIMNVPVLISRSCKLNNNDKLTCSKPIARDNCFSLIIMSELLHTFEAEQNSTGPVHSHLHRKGFQLEEIKKKTVSENKVTKAWAEYWFLFWNFKKVFQLFLESKNNKVQAICHSVINHDGHLIENQR